MLDYRSTVRAVIDEGTFFVDGHQQPDIYVPFLRRNEAEAIENEDEEPRERTADDWGWLIERISDFCRQSTASIQGIIVRQEEGAVMTFELQVELDPGDVHAEAQALVDELMKRCWSGIHIMTGRAAVKDEHAAAMPGRFGPLPVREPRVIQGITAPPFSNAPSFAPKLKIAEGTEGDEERTTPGRRSA